jgi:NodT family efflux transporter outer membrane factor (OMF) lipoprotein
MTNRKTTRTIVMAATALATFLSGCTVGPKYHVPAPAQAPALSYKEIPKSGDGWQIAEPADAKLRGKWWEIFGDPELNALEEQLDINNQNIKQYFENYMEARALVRQARSEYFPTVTVGPSFNRQRSSSNLKNSSTVVGSTGTGTSSGTGTGNSVATNTGSESTLWSAPLDISWEPDLWGKIRNYVKEERAAAQLSAADLENEKLTEEASLAEYFFEIRGQDALIDVFNKTVAADQKSLDYTQNQYDTGVGDKISVVEAQNTLQAAQASATNLQVARAQYEHAIAVLVGHAPADLSIPPGALMTNVPVAPPGVPSLLLQRRPDVAAAERAMAEENALIGVAVGAYYPDLSLSALGGYSADPIGGLFSVSNALWSLGADATENVFEGGTRSAAVRAAQFGYEESVANYRETVLTAFQDVENDLSNLRILAEQAQAETAAVNDATRAVQIALNEYEAGTQAYTAVVTAQVTLLGDQQAALAVQQNRLLSSVALFEDLGGGFTESSLPSAGALQERLPFMP